MVADVFGQEHFNVKVKSEVSLGTVRGVEVAIAFDSTSSMAFDTRWNTAMNTMKANLREMKKLSGKKNFFVTLVPFRDRVNIGTANSGWLDTAAPAGWSGCVDPREEVEAGFPWALDNDVPSAQPFPVEAPITDAGWGGQCPNVSITGPTNKPKEIVDAMNTLTPGGSGRFDVAMAWAWRTVSPDWKGLWGKTGYPGGAAEDRVKKIIFISDGNADTSLYELSKERSWEHNQGSVVAFQHMVEVCRKAKEDGVEIFMLKIVGNPHADEYFQQCATSPDHYYNVTDASDITVPFEKILGDMEAKLRLVK